MCILSLEEFCCVTLSVLSSEKGTQGSNSHSIVRHKDRTATRIPQHFSTSLCLIPMMNTRNQEKTIMDSQLKDLVYKSPAVLPLFDRFNLDFCCHGSRTLREATGSERKARQIATLINEQIKTHKYGVLPQELDIDQVKTMDTCDLCDYIVARFHDKVRKAEPLCKHLARMLYQTHGSERSELKQIKDLVQSVFDDQIKHMKQEENFLFPKMKNFSHIPDEKDRDTIIKFATDHNDVFDQFQLLKKLTNSYTPQDPNCWSEGRLFQHLKEQDMDAQTHSMIEEYHLYNKMTDAHLKLEQQENELTKQFCQRH
mmetsp:Transcript_3998/g.15082  ORF Transcript_3998/g.15082 Transcript_3998/m.15082 type:complete len:312 (-) Transcript_3998:57-992(-)